MGDEEKKRPPSEWLLALALAVPLTFWQGWMVARLWRWFVVPIGAPAIGLAQAVGLAVIVAMFRRSRGGKLADDHVALQLVYGSGDRTLQFLVAALAHWIAG